MNDGGMNGTHTARHIVWSASSAPMRQGLSRRVAKLYRSCASRDERA
jgi:hypothetical protein